MQRQIQGGWGSLGSLQFAETALCATDCTKRLKRDFTEILGSSCYGKINLLKRGIHQRKASSVGLDIQTYKFSASLLIHFKLLMQVRRLRNTVGDGPQKHELWDRGA